MRILAIFYTEKVIKVNWTSWQSARARAHTHTQEYRQFIVARSYTTAPAGLSHVIINIMVMIHSLVRAHTLAEIIN